MNEIDRKTVFVTGGTGLVGRSIVSELVAAGYRVVGLARSVPSDSKLRALGADAVKGDLHSTDLLYRYASSHGVVVHVGFDYETNYPDAVRIDRRAVEAMIAGISVHAGHFVYTSSAFLLGDLGNVPISEITQIREPAGLNLERFLTERQVLTEMSLPAVASVVRLGMVYGGLGGIMGELEAIARTGSPVPYIGDGSQLYPMVHLDDVANLYRRVVERRAGGMFHAVDDSPICAKDIAEAVATRNGKHGATVSLSIQEARWLWGSSADTLAQDVRVCSARSRTLGWLPRASAYARTNASGAVSIWKSEKG